MEDKQTVIIADQNRNVVRAARKILEETGVTVSGVDNGVDILVQLSIARPLAVLVDRHCPELDGLEICALLRSRSEYRELPVVLMCEALSPFDRLKADALGISGILEKPFGRKEVLVHLPLKQASEADSEADLDDEQQVCEEGAVNEA